LALHYHSEVTNLPERRKASKKHLDGMVRNEENEVENTHHHAG
jgi:hypothetical protein